MRKYEESLNVYRDNYSILETAKNEERMDIAKRLKQKGVDIKIITKTTELTKEQIEKL